MSETPSLASDFRAATRDDWLAAVERILKGGNFAERLVGRTADGIAVQPIYEPAEASGIVLGGRGAAPWKVVARVDHPDPAAANELLLDELSGGADAVALTFPQAGTARGFGLARGSVDSLDAALAGVMLDLVDVRVEAGRAGRGAAALVAALAERRGHSLADLDLDLGLDPIGAAARDGAMSAPWPVVAERLGQTYADLAGRGFTGRLANADGRPYHEAGASEAEELAAVAATAVAYLRAVEAGGAGLDQSRSALSFTMAADADEFLTVAKFRAIRLIWARIEEACSLTPRAIRLHAETSWRATTQRDVWVNMLRGTLAAFSAGIAGADSIAVLPFTLALGLPDAFARRVARNSQLILLEEANLWRVADPVAGSGAFEALTESLAGEAWVRFAEIEREGGIAASLLGGHLQARISATATRRAKSIARRRTPLTGTSEFPDLHETPVAVLAKRGDRTAGRPAKPPAPMPAAFADLIASVKAGEDLDALTPAAGVGAALDVLPDRRDGAQFEALRDRSDAILAATGRRPRVFLANLGPVSAFSARAAFARGAFESCGIEAVVNDGYSGHDELISAFRTSGAALACLCSSDEIYETQAAAAAGALTSGGAEQVLLAGRPGVHEDAWRAAGITRFLYAGLDLPEALAGTLG